MFGGRFFGERFFGERFFGEIFFGGRVLRGGSLVEQDRG
jgi:hypothetical protein